MIVALLLKEAQQHAPAILGACAMVVTATFVSTVIGLQEGWVSLLAAAHGLVWIALPLLVLFVDGRLVVHDHQAGTHEFLAALPISPWMRAAVRFGLGLAVAWSVAFAVLLSVALFASRREGVPAALLLQLAVQFGAYLFAWHGLAFGIAHTGRYRLLLWWMLFVGLPLAEVVSDDPLASVYWFGSMADGVDRARMSPPWGALPITLLWGGLGTAAGFFLSTYRGGALLERWFRPTTAHERGRLIGVGVAAMLAAGALGEQAPRRDPWRTLPAARAERATVRVAASPGAPLWRVGDDVAAQLDALGDALGIAEWPPVVLLRMRPEVGVRPVVRAAGDEPAPVTLVLRVDPTHPHDDLVQRVLAEALAHRLAGLVDWDPDSRWLVDGLAPWWVAADRPLLRRRAALGVGRADDARQDWQEVRRDLGPDVASAVAWAGLVALEDTAGREAVLALASSVLRPRPSSTWRSGVRLRWTTRAGWVGRTTGVDEATWLQAWEQALASVPAPTLPALPPLTVEVRGGEALVIWTADPPPATVLEWTTLDPLQAGPLPDDRTERLEPPEGTTEAALRADIRGSMAARWVHVDPALGLVTSPWTVRR